jgi:hypothetical protein
VKFNTLYGLGLHGTTLVRLLGPKSYEQSRLRGDERTSDMIARLEGLTVPEKLELVNAISNLSVLLRELQESDVKL